MREASERIVPCSLELGGKSPIIVSAAGCVPSTRLALQPSVLV